MSSPTLATAGDTSARPDPIRRVTIFGSTGTVGRHVVAELARTGHLVRAVVRRAESVVAGPDGRAFESDQVERVLVDDRDPESLIRVCCDTDAVFVLVGTHPDQVETECRIVDAAALAGARRVVKMSAPQIEGAPPMAVAERHREIERHLAGTGIEHTNIRPMAFAQNWLRDTFPITHLGQIAGSAGDAPRNYVDASDVAAIAAGLLVSDAPPGRTAIAVSGPEAITYPDVADRITRLTGRTVRYVDLSPDDHRRLLIERAGLPDWLAEHIVDLDALARTVPEHGSNDIERLLGRPPRTFDRFLHDHVDAFSPDRANDTTMPAVQRLGSTRG